MLLEDLTAKRRPLVPSPFGDRRIQRFAAQRVRDDGFRIRVGVRRFPFGGFVDCFHDGIFAPGSRHVKRCCCGYDGGREPCEESIFSEECRSLIAEVRGNLLKAIRHREREIALIRRLHELALGQPGEKNIMCLHGYDDLSYRMDMLAILYHDAGKTARAIALLEDSRTLCESHGLPFDGADVYEEYQREVKSPRQKRRTRTA